MKEYRQDEFVLAHLKKGKNMRIIHGIPYTRVNYIIWAMKELGLDYEINPVNPMKGETKMPEHLARNPNGLIPVLEEDGFFLWESMAINSYLAKKYGDGLLWATDPHEEAEIMQWCVFGSVNIDKPAVNYILHKQALPEEMRDENSLRSAQEDLIPFLKVLDGHLAHKEYLVGGRFTIADLNLSAMLDYLLKSRFDLSEYKSLKPWLARCVERPARIEMGGKHENVKLKKPS